MTDLEVIGFDETAIVSEIMKAAYVDIAQHPRRPSEELTPEFIGRTSLCGHASDALTRAAHDHGVYAEREKHEGHTLTTLSAPGTPPSDDDPVICLTWGQFAKAQYADFMANSDQEFPGFFGRRGDLIERLRGFKARETDLKWYEVDTVKYRQVSYTRHLGAASWYLWLNSTPQEVAAGKYPVGVVSYDSYPYYMWDTRDG